MFIHILESGWDILPFPPYLQQLQFLSTNMNSNKEVCTLFYSWQVGETPLLKSEIFVQTPESLSWEINADCEIHWIFRTSGMKPQPGLNLSWFISQQQSGR